MRRPVTMEEFREANARFGTEEGYNKGLAFQPRPTDIFISPYAKCGTTWMQQIVHGLRTGGDMDFGEITEVTPWIELAYDINLDPEAEQKANPRAYKSHLRWNEIPKGGRYIVVLRDPVDAFLSFFNFMEGWYFETGSIPIEDFAQYVLSRPEEESYWGHLTSWWGQRDNPDVLLFAYENMKQDLPGTVARVAAFMGGYDAARIALATEQASFAFMKAHADRFDDNYLRRIVDPMCGLPPSGVATKVSEGAAGQGKRVVSAEIRAQLDARWAKTMRAQFGLENYADLLASLPR